jgi:DNA helicase II / ATP-dependent DNA helicase PcrA
VSKQPAVRQAALTWRQKLAGSDELIPADELLARGLALTGLSAHALPTGDPLLAGAFAVLDRELTLIWYDSTLTLPTQRFSLAHELAHWLVHDSQGPCGEGEIDPQPVADPLPFGEAYVQGYSPAQRRETEANVFAAELLAPAPALRKAFDLGQTPKEIAVRVGISETTVLGQMSESLLLEPTAYPPAHPDPCPQGNTSSLDQLDDSQRAAAVIQGGPTLVVAGPGTGKTRTLVARIEFLLQQGTVPAEILALTFSNRAANEMRERLEQFGSHAGRGPWIGTFHAFGLELLRRFGTRLGLPAAPTLLDPLDAITLMEHRLTELELEEYEYLHDPILPMRDLLGAISRAKDELKSPADYAKMAARMAVMAEDEAAAQEARKAAEVARVYARWQTILQREGMLDFGDLLYRSVELLQQFPDVRDLIRDEFSQILVDEYQDINRASAVLVRELVGDGSSLWLVGDLRQAIYRFRGASPANVGAFEEDYPTGRRVSLDVNYRSQGPLVQLFSSVAKAIGQPAGDGWRASRELGAGTLVFGDAEDEWAQADHIAAYIESFAHQGFRYRDQAVLCRTHRHAELLGALLEERGVPVVYLGDLLARPEIKDLLALLSVACEGTQGLRRVAEIADYQIPEDEVRRIVSEAGSGDVLATLAKSDHAGARTLHAHLAPIAFAGDAHSFFTRYLFGASSYLRRLVVEESVGNRQRRIAIHQLLILAKSFRPDPSGEHPHRAFLAHTRRLLATGEETRAAIPAAISEIDGVRLMTVHAAKGLEFPVVFVPNLVEGMFPPRTSGRMVRLPPGLVGVAGSEAEEEERLFFVALSRARDHLVLSFPRSVAGRQTRPSPLLSLVRQPLAASGVAVEAWKSTRPEVLDVDPGVQSVELYPVEQRLRLSEVEAYLRCPRQYFYRYRERVAEPGGDRPYALLAAAARRLVRWYQMERSAGRSPDDALVDCEMEDAWNSAGLADHPQAALLRKRLELVRSTIDRVDSGEPHELVAQMDGGSIVLQPDGMTDNGEVVHIERHHLGRQSAGHRTAPVLSLYRVAAQQRGAREVKVFNRYLITGEIFETPPNARYEPGRHHKYETALLGIRRGQFDASPAAPNECNRCPFFLVCPH